jgi:hypothetical protein
MPLQKPFEEINSRIKQIIATSPLHDLEKNVRALFDSTLTHLNVAARDDLDAQAALLARTRAKLDALEKRVAKMEKDLSAEANRNRG